MGETRVITHNVGSYTDTLGFFVAMKAWRDVLLTVSHGEWGSGSKEVQVTDLACAAFSSGEASGSN